MSAENSGHLSVIVETLANPCLGSAFSGGAKRALGPLGWKAEIHGGAIGAFLLKRRAPEERFDSRCVELAASVAIPLPIRLGMSRTEVVRLLGQPLAKSGRTEAYSGCQRVKLRPTGAHEARDFDLCSSLFVRFKAELVEAFEVWRTTTS